MELSQIAGLSDRAQRLQAFAEHVETTIEAPLEQLEKDLALHRLEATRSFLVAGFAQPMTAAAVTGNFPLATTAS
ncbi:hypothetical protein ACIA5C_47785 [Actinoplanes sp. NPDC051343]|uniref:hypothetical protein n=1 Tax=Actinoplanes sp. NPDC051343 TaxID=3363906 RepID=UPI0037A6B40D